MVNLADCLNINFPEEQAQAQYQDRVQYQSKNMSATKCPFKVGDIVVYRPTLHNRGHVVMTELYTLKPGTKCKIARIDDELYVVVESFENAAGGGLYWTEFSAK